MLHTTHAAAETQRAEKPSGFIPPGQPEPGALPFPVTPHMAKPPSPSKADFYQLIRARIEKEDELVNQRLIWMVFSQSFMFSAFAILTNAPEKPKTPTMGAQQDLLLWIIPVIALFACALIYIGLLASLLTLKGLRKRYDNYPDDGTADHLPPIQNIGWVRLLSAMAPIGLPLLFVLTWLMLLLNQVIQTGRTS